MAGDNNLDGAALRDIAEMAKAGSTKDVHVLVQLDRLEDRKTRRFRITPGGGFKKDCIDTFSETNTGDPQILYSFCQWAIANYPAVRYALILWNHGSGWWEDARGRAVAPAAPAPANPESPADLGEAARPDRSTASLQPGGGRAPSGIAAAHRRRLLFGHTPPQAHRSICYDDTSGGDALDNRELRVVLAGVCALLGRKIDLLGMDACLMNMVEVAWQLRDAVQVIVGSEIEEPFDGWPYAEILARLTGRPRQDAATFARRIVRSYLASYQGKGETVTQSALDMGRTADAVTKIDVLAGRGGSHPAYLSGIHDIQNAAGGHPVQQVIDVAGRSRIDALPQSAGRNFKALVRLQGTREDRNGSGDEQGQEEERGVGDGHGDGRGDDGDDGDDRRHRDQRDAPGCVL